MANSAPSAYSNARQPNFTQGGPGVQLVPAPQGAYFQGVQTAPPGVNPGYRASAGWWTGGIQLACGVASTILGIVNIVIHTWLAPLGTGIWAGMAFYIATGILGIVSAKKSRCVIIAYMVMSILSSVAAGTAVVIFILEAVEFRYYYYYGNSPGAAIAIIVLLMVVSLIELVTSVTAAAFCCAGTACCSSPSATATPMIYYQTPAGGYAMPPAGGYAMPPGMVAFSSPGPQAAPGAHNGNNYIQQPFPMAPGQPPMQWQNPMPTQPPAGQQTQNGPTGGEAMAQAQAGGEKPPPYN